MSEKTKTAPKAPEEIEIRVSTSWVRLIRWCQVHLPHGQLSVKIVNGQPTELIVDTKPGVTRRRIRFDREETIPQSFDDTQF